MQVKQNISFSQIQLVGCQFRSSGKRSINVRDLGRGLPMCRCHVYICLILQSKIFQPLQISAATSFHFNFPSFVCALWAESAGTFCDLVTGSAGHTFSLSLWATSMGFTVTSMNSYCCSCPGIEIISNNIPTTLGATSLT